MGANWSPYVALLLATGVTDLVAAAVVWRRRLSIGRTSLCLVLVAAAVWSIAYALELVAAATSDLREVGGYLQYVGTTLLPPAWLIFAMQYTGRLVRVGRRVFAALAGGPVLGLSLVGVSAGRGGVPG